ncbi:hypothetical protein JI59_21935 (plasmid) [Novosphingobium pentaromativorans US6-1]|nr:hypothetical protein JI59_21935 [Novosphingobium pentaromativorans US6-1]
MTARRRDENLQKVPIAITALTADTLREKQISEPSDLMGQTPGLTVQGGGFLRNAAYSIRGQPAGSSGVNSSGTILYRAEVPAAAVGRAPQTPYYDLESIQVLKGPQGTLFGGTSTGGAVLLTPQMPKNDFEGYASSSVGNLDFVDLEGALNLPIVSDRLLLRIAGKVTRRKGYTHNIYDGADLDNVNGTAFRVSMTLRPTDGLTNSTIYEHTWRNERGGNSVAFLCNPNGTIALSDPQWFALCEAATKLGPRVVNNDLTGLNYLREDFLANTTTLDLTDDIQLKNIFGYIRTRTGNRNDSDGTPRPAGQVANPYPQYLLNTTNQLTDEFHVEGRSFNQSLEWIVGGFFARRWEPEFNHLMASLAQIPAGTLYNVASKSETKQRALFAQATVHLDSVVNGLSATAGMRHTWNDDSALSGANLCLALPDAPLCAIFGSTNFTPDVNVGVVPSKAKSERTTYTFSLDYQLNRSILLYAAHRTGYLPGGTNRFGTSGLAVYEPETVSDFEIGAKTTFEIGTVIGRFNLAAYRNDYKNSQRSLQTGPASNIVINAEKALIQGIELDFGLKLTDWLMLSGNYSYLDAGYKKYVNPLTNADISGTPFALAPTNTGSVSATITLPVRQELGTVDFNVDASFRSGTSFSPDIYQLELFQPAYRLVNMRLSWKGVAGQPLDLSFFAKNLFNKTYVAGVANGTYNFNPYPTTGIDTLMYGEPRTYGVTMRYRFGD